MSADELAIRGVECFGHHGVFDHERRDGQPFVIDLTLVAEALDAPDGQLVGAHRRSSSRRASTRRA